MFFKVNQLSLSNYKEKRNNEKSNKISRTTTRKEEKEISVEDLKRIASGEDGIVN